MAPEAVHSSLLVPLDGSALADQAIPWALALATADSRIVLLRVLPPPGAAEEVLGRRDGADPGAAEAAARTQLAASAATAGGRGNVELAVASGDPAETIVAEATRLAAGSIVIASHGRGAVGRWLFGSVAERVARLSDVPVVIVRREEDEPADAAIRRVVVPLDGSARSMEALPAARSVAAAHRLPIHLISAVDVSSLTAVATPGVVMPVSGELYTQVYNDLESGAKAALTEAEAELSGTGAGVTSEVRVGPPYGVIVDVLRPGDLLVLTSHGRTGVRRWLLGSVAEQLVRFAPAPVMLVPSTERAAATGAA